MAAYIGGRHLQLKEQFSSAILEPFAEVGGASEAEADPECKLG